MRHIKRFIILAMSIACFLIHQKSNAQYPQYPSWKYMTNYGNGSDSGVFYCITDTIQYQRTHACTIPTPGSPGPPAPTLYWIHLRNLVGKDLGTHNIIGKVEIIVNSVYPPTDMAITGQDEFIGVDTAEKNFSVRYTCNGFPHPWDMAWSSTSNGSGSFTGPLGCIDIGSSWAEDSYTLTFTPFIPTPPATGDYRIHVLDHFSVSILDYNNRKLTLKVYFEDGSGNQWAGNPLTFLDFQNKHMETASPSTVPGIASAPS